MTPCKACGEPMRFLRTPAGKFLPVDAESFGTHHLGPGMTVVTEAGEVLRGSPATSVTSVQGYTPHWATCTHPDLFRRAR